jgi:hypothetical protein
MSEPLFSIEDIQRCIDERIPKDCIGFRQDDVIHLFRIVHGEDDKEPWLEQLDWTLPARKPPAEAKDKGAEIERLRGWLKAIRHRGFDRAKVTVDAALALQGDPAPVNGVIQMTGRCPDSVWAERLLKVLRPYVGRGVSIRDLELLEKIARCEVFDR